MLTVEHISAEQLIIFSKQLSERSFLLGQCERRVVDIRLELITEALQLCLPFGLDLDHDSVLVNMLLESRLDILVIEVGEHIDALCEDGLHYLRHFVHIHLFLLHLLTVEYVYVCLMEQILHEIVLIKAEHRQS